MDPEFENKLLKERCKLLEEMYRKDVEELMKARKEAKKQTNGGKLRHV